MESLCDASNSGKKKKKKGSADTPIIRSREVRNSWVIVSVHAVKMNETILTSRR